MASEQIKVQCFGIDENAQGLIKWDGEVIRVAGLLDGEKAIVEVDQKRKFTVSKLIKVEEKSADRVQPKCKHAAQCGGCQLQHMSYPAQLAYKQKTVDQLLKKFGKVNPIIGMTDPNNYRNKVHSTFTSDKRGIISSGMYEEYSHRVIPIESCGIQDERANAIINTVREMMKSFKMKAYNEDTGVGFMRHILIKVGKRSNQIMVVLVVTNNVFPGKNNFIKALLTKHPEITTVLMNINKAQTSMVLGNQEMVLYGKGTIEDTLCDTVFSISAKSFYQINPVQTEILYTKALEMAKFTGKERILDAYCGIGTIGLIASKKVKEVVGVELNKDAVKDAINNSKRNQIKNAKFYQGDAGEFMDGMAEDKQTFDVVFMDPPRSGSDEKFLASLVKMGPKKVVYVSCSPFTLERDLKYLTKNGYKVEEMQPVDMFPMTSHVECVVGIQRVESTK